MFQDSFDKDGQALNEEEHHLVAGELLKCHIDKVFMHQSGKDEDTYRCNTLNETCRRLRPARTQKLRNRLEYQFNPSVSVSKRRTSKVILLAEWGQADTTLEDYVLTHGASVTRSQPATRLNTVVEIDRA
jgi:hypothetical protein